MVNIIWDHCELNLLETLNVTNFRDHYEITGKSPYHSGVYLCNAQHCGIVVLLVKFTILVINQLFAHKSKLSLDVSRSHTYNHCICVLMNVKCRPMSCMFL